MGWTGGDETLVQVCLTFPTREAAERYARREGLSYVVRLPVDRREPPKELTGAAARPALLTVAADMLDARYGRTRPVALERALRDPAGAFAAPEEVLRDPRFSTAERREILRRWAWDEYLLDLASGESGVEGARDSRLGEVRAALLRLEEPAALLGVPELRQVRAAA